MAAERGIRLQGRERTISLVREFAARPEKGGLPRNRPSPIVVFTGGRGNGKSALLKELADRMDQQIPHASIDCEQAGHTTTSELLSGLTFELNLQRGRYRRLTFPRFWVGHIAISEKLKSTDPDSACRQIEGTLRRHGRSDQLRTFLESNAPVNVQFTGDGANSVQAQNINGPVIFYGGSRGRVQDARRSREGVLKGLSRPWRRLDLEGGRRWYGHQGRGLRHDSGHVLVNLNRIAGSHDVDDQREADVLLWEAFLADLRENFGRWKAASWSLNCVILFDNADSPRGRRFQEGLIEARRRHPAQPDPLTVVATSRSSVDTPVFVERASYADHLERDRDVYPVMLPDLTKHDVVAMLEGLDLTWGNPWKLASEVHTFTRGHTGSTRIVLDTLQNSPEPVDLRAVLDTAAGSGTVEDELVRQLLPGLDGVVFDDLVTCSAARDLGQALRMSVDSGLLGSNSRQRSKELFAPDLWVPTESDGPVELRPVLRRLLLRKLADRPETHRANWTGVNEWLRDDRQADEVSELHHRLALGEVGPVTRKMADSLRSKPIREWLVVLEDVTGAPNRLSHGCDPIAEVTALTEWVDPQDVPIAPLARLIASLWLERDPLVTPHRKALLEQIAWEFQEIAPHSGKGHAVLREEAFKYQRRAEQ